MEKCQGEKLYNETIESVKDSTLLHLNDDCLIHLCGYLNIFDLMNVADTCIRLLTIIAHSQYKKIKSFEWNQFEHLPVNADLNKVISLIGTQLLTLTFNGSYEQLSAKDYCGSIREKCLHVKTLKLIGSHNYTSIIGETDLLQWLRAIRLENLCVFWSKMDKAFWQINTLKSLTISFCSISQTKLNWLLGNNKQIESLMLNKLEFDLDLRKLVKLQMLHTLSIEIRSHRVAHLSMLVSELKQLKKFKIKVVKQHWANNSTTNFNNFLEKLANGELDELIVDGMYFNRETFAKFRLLKLKSMALMLPTFDKSLNNIPLKLVDMLDYMDSLEHIRLKLAHISLSADDIFMMISRLEQLVELNLFDTHIDTITYSFTAANIMKTLNQFLEQQNRTTILRLTLSKLTINLFLKSYTPVSLFISHWD